MATKRTVSLVVAIIMLVVGAAAGVGVGYFGAPRTTTSGPLCSSGQTITIGELLDLSGSLSDQGKKAQDSSTLAINDINAALSASGCSLRFANQIQDYAHDNNVAQQKLTSFAASGIQVVVGPLNSAAANFILTYANNHHIVLISPSSTSPTLAIAGDYLFRTAPNDAAQGAADGRMLWDRGARAIIVTHLSPDAYGDGLANATEVKFKSLGGTVIDDIPYDPNLRTGFPVDKIYTDYTSHNSSSTPVGLDFISFQEFGEIINEMNNAHPSLLNTRMPWFGTDGELPSTLYAGANNTKTVAFLNAFAAAYPNVACDTYCLGTYDDLWLGALATLNAGVNDGAKIQPAMLSTASGMYGLTGWMGLQPSGDRLPTSYQIWKVIAAGTGGTWTQAGTWDDASDSITWIGSPP